MWKGLVLLDQVGEVASSSAQDIFFSKAFFGWWLNHPFEKYATVKLDNFAYFRDENI